MKKSLLLLSIICCCACASVQTNQKNKPSLEASVRQMIECLNQRDAEGLSKLYAKDFEGIVPKTEGKDINQFVKTTIENFKKYNFQIEIKIHEIYQTKALGYVVMDWQLLTKKQDGTYTVEVASQRLDIWEYHKKQWQLKRSLFYKENAF